jgi:autotransporter-associated beta strand protein
LAGGGNILLSGNFSTSDTNWDAITDQSSGVVTVANSGSGAQYNMDRFFDPSYFGAAGVGTLILESSNAASGIDASTGTVQIRANGAVTQYIEVGDQVWQIPGIVDLGATTNTIATLGVNAGSLVGRGVLNVTGSISTVSGQISENINGGAGLTQAENFSAGNSPGGVTILLGSNGYTGQTVIGSGTLLIDGTNSGGGSVTVDPTYFGPAGPAPSNNVAVLGGTGNTAASTVTVTNGGIIAPGGLKTPSSLTIDSPGTLTIGALTMNTGALNILLSGATGSALAVSGDINLSGTNALSFSVYSPLTSPIYTFLTWTGVFSGAFTTTNGVPAGYMLVNGGNSEYLQYVNTNWSTHPDFDGTNAVIVGGSTNFSAGISNASSLSSLDYTVTSGSNTTGSPAAGSLGTNASTNVPGLTFTSSNTPGVQTGTYTVVGNNISTNTGVVSVTVYDHASGSVSTNSIALSNAIVGYSAPIAAHLVFSNAPGLIAPLQVTSTGSGPVTLDNVASLSAGGSTNATLSFATGQSAGQYTNSVDVVYGDAPSLSGANTNLSTSTITATETIYNHAVGSLSTNVVAFQEEHVGYTGSLTADIGVSNAAGLNVDLKTFASSTNSHLSLGIVADLAQGGATNVTLTLKPGQRAGVFTNNVSVVFGDASMLAGASSNVGSATIAVSGVVYSGQATWINNGGGDWTSFANWDVNGGTPGLDGALSVNDSATFGSDGSGTVTLNTNALLAAMTFSNSTASYFVGGTGTITLQTNALVASLAGSHTLTSDLDLTGVTTIGGGGVLSLAGNVYGSGGFVQNGSGSTILSGSNSYTGGVVVNNGTLVATNGNALAGGVVVINGGTLDLASSESVESASLNGGAIAGSGTLTALSIATVSGSASSSLSAGSLTQDGVGTTTLSGSNSFTSGVTVNRGTLIATNGYALGGAYASVYGGSLDVATSETFSGAITGAGSLTAASFTTVSGAISASLTGNGFLQQVMSGTTVLSGSNSFTGGTIVLDGTLVATNGHALAGGGVSVQGGGVLDVAMSESVGNLSIGGDSPSITPSIIGNGTLTASSFTATNGNISASLSGFASFTKNGSGVVSLSGTNAFGGGTVINGGTLVATGALALSDGNLTINGGTLAINSTVNVSTFLWNNPSLTSSVVAIRSPGSFLKAFTLSMDSNAVGYFNLSVEGPRFLNGLG